MAPPGMEEMTNQLQGMFQNLAGDTKKKRKLKIKDAMKALAEEEAAKLVNQEELKEAAIFNVENNGIVSLMKSTRFVSAAKALARTCLVKVCNVTYFL